MSNNQRNASRKGDLVAARMTTTARTADLPRVVRLTVADHLFAGFVLCDDPYVTGVDEIDRSRRSATASTVRAVDAALRLGLGL